MVACQHLANFARTFIIELPISKLLDPLWRWPLIGVLADAFRNFEAEHVSGRSKESSNCS